MFFFFFFNSGYMPRLTLLWNIFQWRGCQSTWERCSVLTSVFSYSRGSPSRGWGCFGCEQRELQPPLGQDQHTGTRAGRANRPAETDEDERVFNFRILTHSIDLCCSECVCWLPVWFGWRTKHLETSVRLLSEETAGRDSESGKAPTDGTIYRCGVRTLL